MPIKFFCDLCGTEATNTKARESQPVFEAHVVAKPVPGAKVIPDKVGVRLIRSVRGCWNGGILCNSCLAKALQSVVNQLLTEPKDEEADANAA